MPPVASSICWPVQQLPSGRGYLSRKSSNLCATCNPSPPKSPVFVQFRIPRDATLDSSNKLVWSVEDGSCELLLYGVLGSWGGPGPRIGSWAAVWHFGRADG